MRILTTIRFTLIKAFLISFMTGSAWSLIAAEAAINSVPDSGSTPPVRYLEVSQFFALPQSGPDNRSLILTMMWKNDRLWLGVRDRAKTWEEPDKMSVRRIDLDGFQEERRWDYSTPPPVEHWLIGQGGFFDVSGDKLFTVITTGKVRIQSLVDAGHREVDAALPAGASVSVQALNGKAYLLTNERVLELDPGSDQIQILASKRRRPAANVLDSVEWIAHPRFIPANGGQAGLAMSTPKGVEFYDKAGEGNAWTNRLEVPGSIDGLTADGDGLLYSVDGNGAEIRMLGSGNVSILYSTTKPTAGKWEASPRTTAYPADGFNGPGNVTASQTNLWVLMGPHSFRRSPFTTPAFILPSRATNSQAILWYFDQRWIKPLEIPVRFAAASNSNLLAKVSQSLLSGKPQLLATPKGLIIAVPDRWPSPFFAGFYFIPQKQLDAWFEQKAQDTPPAPMAARHERARTGFELHEYKLRQDASSIMLRYDRNNDYQLDEDELLASLNKGLRSELQVKLMRFNNNAHDLMIAADGNKDGKLDVDEWAEFLSPRFIATQDRPKPWDASIAAGSASEHDAIPEELKARYATRVLELADLVNKAATYDPELAKTLSKEYLTANDAKKMLGLWKAYLQRTKPENRSILVEDHLFARSYSLTEVKDYFSTATSADGRLLSIHIFARNPTAEEARQIKPLFEDFARQLKLADKLQSFVNMLDKAISGQSSIP